jgi:hypothetical protein
LPLFYRTFWMFTSHLKKPSGQPSYESEPWPTDKSIGHE